MDLEMPEMDGIEATKAIRSLPGLTKKPRILAMTGHSLNHIEQACLDAGMDGFIPKPFDLHLLRDSLQPTAAASSN